MHRYQTQLCPEHDRCQRKHCWHAHSQSELRVPTDIPETNPVLVTPEAAAAIAQAAIPAQAFGQAGSSQRHLRQQLGSSHSTRARVGFTALSTVSAGHAGGMLVQGQHAAASIPRQQPGVRWVPQHAAHAHVPAWVVQQQQQMRGLVSAQPAHMQQGGGAVGAAQGVANVVLQQMPQDHVVQQHSQGVVQVFQLPQQLSPGQAVQGAQFQQLPQHNQGVLQPRQQPQQVQYVPAQAVAAGQVVLQQHSPQAQQWQGQQQVQQQHAAGYVLQQTGQPALQQVSAQLQQPQLVLTVPDMPLQQLQLRQATQMPPQQQRAQPAHSLVDVQLTQGAREMAPSQGFGGIDTAWAALPHGGLAAGPNGPGSGIGILAAPGAGAIAAQGEDMGLEAGVLLVPAGAGGYDILQLPAGMQVVARHSSCTPDGTVMAAVAPGVVQAAGIDSAVVQLPAQQQDHEQQQAMLQQLMHRFGSTGLQ